MPEIVNYHGLGMHWVKLWSQAGRSSRRSPDASYIIGKDRDGGGLNLLALAENERNRRPPHASNQATHPVTLPGKADTLAIAVFPDPWPSENRAGRLRWQADARTLEVWRKSPPQSVNLVTVHWEAGRIGGCCSSLLFRSTIMICWLQQARSTLLLLALSLITPGEGNEGQKCVAYCMLEDPGSRGDCSGATHSKLLIARASCHLFVYIAKMPCVHRHMWQTRLSPESTCHDIAEEP